MYIDISLLIEIHCETKLCKTIIECMCIAYNIKILMNWHINKIIISALK